MQLNQSKCIYIAHLKEKKCCTIKLKWLTQLKHKDQFRQTHGQIGATLILN